MSKIQEFHSLLFEQYPDIKATSDKDEDSSSGGGKRSCYKYEKQ